MFFYAKSSLKECFVIARQVLAYNECPQRLLNVCVCVCEKLLPYEMFLIMFV